MVEIGRILPRSIRRSRKIRPKVMRIRIENIGMNIVNLGILGVLSKRASIWMIC